MLLTAIAFNKLGTLKIIKEQLKIVWIWWTRVSICILSSKKPFALEEDCTCKWAASCKQKWISEAQLAISHPLS